MVCCRYLQSSEGGSVDVWDFKIELFMNILSQFLVWQLFGLLVPNLAEFSSNLLVTLLAVLVRVVGLTRHIRGTFQ